MNVEMFFVRAPQSHVVGLVRERLNSPADPVGTQPDWGLPSAYDSVMVDDPKRKVAISSPHGGWLSCVESKETLDFRLLQQLSDKLQTTVIAVQLYEVTGSLGYASCAEGSVTKHFFTEDAPDPRGIVSDFLRLNGIGVRLASFSQAVRNRAEGWMVVVRDSIGATPHGQT